MFLDTQQEEKKNVKGASNGASYLKLDLHLQFSNKSETLGATETSAYQLNIQERAERLIWSKTTKVSNQ